MKFLKHGALQKQRTCATFELGAERKMNETFRLIRAEHDGEKKIRVGKELSLFRCAVGGHSENYETASVEFMKFVLPLDDAGSVLGVANVRRTAADDGKNTADVDTLEGENSHTAADEGSGLISSERILSTLHAI